MAVRNDFTAGEVLAAADLNDTFASKVDYATPTNAQAGTAYTFVADDAEKLTTASNGSAVTLTIPPASSVAWPDNTILRVVNYGAGAVTVDGGSGVTVTNTATTLAQYESGAAIRTGSDAWTFVPFSGGVGNADFSDAATGTYTDGVDYKYITYTASGTLTVTRAGFADILVVGGGGGGYVGGGGAGGYLEVADSYLPVGTLTVVVGGGGAGGVSTTSTPGLHGGASRLWSYYAVQGAGSPFGSGVNGFPGASGSGGERGSTTGGSGTSGQGNNGGNGNTNAGGGGGGAGANGSNATSGGGGAGGAGSASAITGSSITRAGGGGGAGSSTQGSASGGGGAGNASAQSSGSANTGGGGGGRWSGTPSGNGGSGVVIVRVRV